MKNHSDSKKAFYAWLPLALAATAVMGFAYTGLQQNYRMTANDPQIQLVEDAQTALEAGLPPEAIAAQQPTDIGKSLSPYFLVFDQTGKPVSGTGLLDEKQPNLPNGVFKTANSGQYRFTWQPRSNLRQALVLSKYSAKVQTASGTQESSGYIAVGRSLREAEKRIKMLGVMALVVWVFTLLISYLAMLLAVKKITALHNSKVEDLPEMTE